MARWVPVLFSFVLVACDIATGLNGLQFDLPGGGGAAAGGFGGTGGFGGAITEGVVSFGERPDADVTGVTRDTYLVEATPALNFGGAPVLEAADRSRLLFRFDLSSVAPGTPVVSAALDLVTDVCSACQDMDTFTFHTMLQRWTQGIQNGNEGAASWNLATAGEPWSAPGADQGSHDPDEQIAFATSLSSAETIRLDLDPDVVQRWVDDPDTNFGMVSISDGGSEVWRVVSSEGTADARPLLVLTLGDS